MAPLSRTVSSSPQQLPGVQGGSPAPRRAASVVVVRPRADDFEVLMLLRASNGDQNSGAWVFPGGVLEPSDDAAALSWQRATPTEDLAFRVAAMRECLEEVGVVPGLGASVAGGTVDLRDWQRRLNDGSARLQDLCGRDGVEIDLRRWRHFAHWVTPPGMPKRFDTRFFLAPMDTDQAVSIDGREIVDHAWLRVGELLDAHPARRLMGVTREILTTLQRKGGFAAILDWAATLRDVPLVMRRRCTDRNGPRSVMPDHPAWHEIGRLDPDGRGDVSCEWPPGDVVRLSQRVWRLTRHDTGTNLYWIGGPDGWCAVAVGGVPPGLDSPPRPGRIVAAVSQAAELAGPLRFGGERTCTLAPVFDVSTQRAIGILLAEEETLFTFDGDAAGQWPETLAVAWLAPPVGFLRPGRG